MAGVNANPADHEYCRSGTSEGFQEYYEISVGLLTTSRFWPETGLFRLTAPRVRRNAPVEIAILRVRFELGR